MLQVVIILCLDVATASNVVVFAPTLAFKGEHIWINCSSDEPPYYESAEFLLDGVTFHTVVKSEEKCFSAPTRRPCHPSSCWCSSNGRSYGIMLHVDEFMGKHIKVSCVIEFENKEFLNKNSSISLGSEANVPVYRNSSTIVEIRELVNPVITVNDMTHISTGSIISLKCSVKIQINSTPRWMCPQGKHVKDTFTNESTATTIEVHMKPNLNGKSCKCVFDYRNLMTLATYTFNSTAARTDEKSSGFDFNNLLILLVSVGVFLTTVGIVDIILVLKIRNFGWSGQIAGPLAAIYYAAPGVHEPSHTYGGVAQPDIRNHDDTNSDAGYEETPEIYRNDDGTNSDAGYEEITDLCSNYDVITSTELRENQVVGDSPYFEFIG